MKRLLGNRGTLRHGLISGAFGSAGLKVGYVGLQFAVGVLLARLLGAQALGQYAFVMAVVQLLAILAQSGFPLYLVRKIALQQEAQHVIEIRRTAICALVAVSSFGLLVVASMHSLQRLDFPSFATVMNKPYLSIASWLVVPLALAPTVAGALKGMGLIVRAQVPELIVKPAILLAILSAVYLVKAPLNVDSALSIQLMSNLSALAIALLSLRVHLPGRGLRVSLSAVARHVGASQAFLLLAGAQVLNSQTNVLLLGMMASPEQVGLYRVAVQVTDGLGVAMFAISAVIAPHIAKFHVINDWGTLQRILVLSHRGAVLVLLLPVLIILGFGSLVLELVFGTEYVAANDALSTLAIGKILYATVGFSGLALSMLGQPGVAAIITVATLILNVLLGLILIPHLGVEGAAVAAAISMWSVNAYTMHWIRKQSGYGLAAFSKIGPCKVSLR